MEQLACLLADLWSALADLLLDHSPTPPKSVQRVVFDLPGSLPLADAVSAACSLLRTAAGTQPAHRHALRAIHALSRISLLPSAILPTPNAPPHPAASDILAVLQRSLASPDATTATTAAAVLRDLVAASTPAAAAAMVDSWSVVEHLLDGACASSNSEAALICLHTIAHLERAVPSAVAPKLSQGAAAVAKIMREAWGRGDAAAAALASEMLGRCCGALSLHAARQVLAALHQVCPLCGVEEDEDAHRSAVRLSPSARKLAWNVAGEWYLLR